MGIHRLEQLRALLIEEPADVFLRYAMALELRRLGRNGEAIEILDGLVKTDPGHIPTYYQLAVLLAEAGEHRDALAACEAGMLRCLVAGDQRTRSELAGLKESIADEAE